MWKNVLKLVAHGLLNVIKLYAYHVMGYYMNCVGIICKMVVGGNKVYWTVVD